MNAKKKALGRGLDALLSGNDTNTSVRNEEVNNNIVGNIAVIRIEFIQANPYQPRNHFEKIALEELASSIKTLGIIQPITVRELGKNKYQIISGERRFRAAKLAKIEEIPAYIRKADDQDMLEMALVENIQREDLNAIEEAHSYERLIDECDLTQEELSKRIGKNRSTITNYLRLLKLPGIVQNGIRDEVISMGHARAIINITDTEVQREIYQMIVDKKLSVREVENLVRIVNNGGNLKKTAVPQKEIPSSAKKAINKLTNRYGSPIDIRMNTAGKGSISIKFNSEGDLNRLLKLLDE